MTQGESARLDQDYPHGLQSSGQPCKLTAKIFSRTFGRNPTRALAHETLRGQIIHERVLSPSRLTARSQAFPY